MKKAYFAVCLDRIAYGILRKFSQLPLYMIRRLVENREGARRGESIEIHGRKKAVNQISNKYPSLGRMPKQNLLKAPKQNLIKAPKLNPVF